MNIERIQLKGQLAEAKSKYKHLDTEEENISFKEALLKVNTKEI